MNNLELYRKLTCELGQIRIAHNGHDSEAEEAHINEMDVVWKQLTEVEKQEVDRWPPLDAPITWSRKTGV